MSRNDWSFVGVPKLVPKRFAGFESRRAEISESRSLPVDLAAASKVAHSRSVSKGPGSRLLMVTLLCTVVRDRPAMKPVRPARAPFDRPRISIGAFTVLEVILMMRPKPRAIMPLTVDRISSMGVSMFASIAAIHCWRYQ